MRFVHAAIPLLTAALLSACGEGKDAEAPATAAPAATEAPKPTMPAATPAPEGAKVFFVEPADGATVSSPVTVVFGIEGMDVAPAGDQTPNTGHHHLLIDEPEVDLGAPLPATEQVVHFGKGQTETTVELPPGDHVLQMVLGDWKHQPHAPPVMSETITVTVTE